MKLQKILATLLAAAAVLCSCEKVEVGNKLPDNVKTDLNFTLTISDLSYNAAQISVKHDGTTNDSWYGFITDQPSGKDAILISQKITEITVNGQVKGLEKRTSKRVELTDLEPATKYRYIVFAITEDGQLYGNMNSIDIETPEGFLLKTVEDWSVSYDGRDASTNNETYTVEFKKNGAARCHVGFIPKWMEEAYQNEPAIQEELNQYGGLRLDIGGQVFLFSILDYLVFEELFEYWGYYDGDDSYFSQETFGESSAFQLPRQASGDYYAVAIGFKDGTPTWTYSVNEVKIVKETASDSYKNWLGDWTLTGANNISYNLTFEENDPNFSYYVYGWECSTSIHGKDCKENCTDHMVYTDFSNYKLGIPFYFDALNGEMFVQSILLGAELSTDGTYYLNWGMFGYTEYEGNTVSILTQEDKIASAAQPADSKSTLNGLASTTYNMDASGNATEVNFTYNSLGYVMYDSKTYAPTPWNVPVTLPATLEKVAASPAMMTRSAGKSARTESAVNSYKKIKSADYSRLVKADILNR